MPTMDGDLTEWQVLGQTLLTRMTPAASVAPNSPLHRHTQFEPATAWLPGALYFAATITDDVLVGNNSSQIWGDDVIELGIRAGSTTTRVHPRR